MALEVRKAEDRIVVRDTDLEDVMNGDADTTYTLRTLTTDKVRELRKPYAKQEFNKRTHRREDVPLTDDEQAALTADLIDYAIVGWTGILYDGQPLDCTKDNKGLLDSVRKSALLSMAGMNQTAKGAQAKAESFRQPA